MLQNEFFKQSASNFCADPQIHNPTQYPFIMEQYDKKVYENFGQHYPQQQTYQNVPLQPPQPNTLVDHFYKNTFISDQNQLQQYSSMLDQVKVQDENNKPLQSKNLLMDHQLGNQFIPIPQNYLDYNVNTKAFGQIDKQSTYLRDPYDIYAFQKSQLEYMQAIHDPSPPEQINNFKQNIQQLGGIEDTIGNMTSTLNQYEIKHLVNKNIKYYPLNNPITNEQVQIQQQQIAQSLPHPFIYNPADDKNRYVYGQLRPPQNIIDQQQTYSSQFYQTQKNEQQLRSLGQQQCQHFTFDSIEKSKQMRQQKLQQLNQK